MTFLIPLTEVSKNIPKELVGGKAYSLIKLNELKLQVPEGFVLEVNSQATFQHDQEHLKTYLTQHLPPIKSDFLMIRSSAVGEDGEHHSFAGQLESFQVKNNIHEITEGIFKCWKSLTNERVQIYQKVKNQSITQMGVIIQKRISPDYSGVFFSSAPDHADFQLVEYVQGDCEKLVQGAVIPESHYLPSKHPFPFDMNELQRDCATIVQFFKQPQDIEWLYANRCFYFVQARPATRAKRRIYWSSTNVNENYPDKLCPLLYSIARRSYYHYFKNLTLKLSILKEGSGESSFYNGIGVWGERMYYNMTQIHTIIALTPFRTMLTHSFNNFVGYQKEKKSAEKSDSMFNKIRFVSKLIFHFARLPRYVRQIEARVDSFATTENTENQLSILYHEFLDIRFNFWFRASFADFFAMIFHGALGKFLERIQIKNSQGLHNTLVQSIPHLVSNGPIFEMWKLKQLIAHEKKEMYFKENPTETIAVQLQTNSELSNIKSTIEQYLQEWGFRCSGELTLLSDNYIENPNRFIEALKLYIKSNPQDPEIQLTQKHQEQQHQLAETIKNIGQEHRWFKSVFYVFLLKKLVKWAIYSISCRERVRLKQAKMYFKFKAVCLSFGALLQSKGILYDKKDIFDLEYDEISRLLNSEGMSKDYLNDLIQLRKRKIETAKEYSENLYSFEFDYTGEVIDQDRLENKNSELRGLPACGGTIQGRAVVLESVHEMDQLRQGDILITKQTDPGWICAFPMISGLIVERGGMLSHGAIIAREFGIPAVVGIKGITTKIKTGDIVFLDGNRGTVECVSS